MEIHEHTVIVAGGGLSGCLMACYLRSKGIDVVIIEKLPDPRLPNRTAGKSINMALSERGLKALRRIGIEKEILEITIPMYGRMIHDKEGNQSLQPYSTDGKRAILSISRSGFNIALLNIAEAKGTRVYFDSRITFCDTRSGTVQVGNVEYRARIVLACDGSHSACRKSIINFPLFNYSQEYLDHSYKELVIPPSGNEENKYLIEKNALHIWPRGTHMLIALPNQDGSFTCTLFMPNFGREGIIGFSDIKTDEDVKKFFESDFKDAVALMPNLVEMFSKNPTSNLITVKCYPWVFNNRLALVGDAAHAVVPFFGQGMNASFEDVRVLDEEMEFFSNGDYTNIPWDKVLDSYQVKRKVNADAISDLALENYVEMRFKVADPMFQFRNKIQAKLGQSFPNQFFTRYEMISFSNIPYEEAKQKGFIIDNIIDELVQGIDDYDVSKVDLDKAKELVDKHFPTGWIQMQ